MADPIDISSEVACSRGGRGDVATDSAGEADPSLVAWIRRVFQVPGAPSGLVDLGREEDNRPGRIGKFEVLKEIGRGGFGTVLLVRDPDLGRERALKVPNPETFDSPGALSRFIGEARLASMVDHPNVVRVYEAETAGILPYIVMEYCPGGSLGRWLAARPARDLLPEGWVASLVAEIAEGVHQAHRAGLIHRDIKPGNILLEETERAVDEVPPRFRPKVADFGLAKVFDEDPTGRSMTASGVPVGTWSYMSPEQARGEKGVFETTDVYSIGAILHELLAGERPYAGLGQAEFLGCLLGPDAPPSPRRLRKDLHRDLETICLKCLEKTPSGRYQDSGELADDLRRHLAGLPILARPASLRARCLSKVRRHPARSALVGLAVASVLGGLVSWARFREMNQRGKIDLLMNRLESARSPDLPPIVAKIDPTDARVSERLRRRFAAGTPTQKLAAALVLARDDPKCRDYSFDCLLDADPQDVPAIASCLRDRMPDLPGRLALVEGTPAPAGVRQDAEDHDRRRANAAAALIILGERERGWSLLRFDPNPQARSFLVHRLGPAGLDPLRIARRIEEYSSDAEPEVSTRRALIQALGEYSPDAWPQPVRDRLLECVLDRYIHDPDSGVHGSAKWLLLRWARGPKPAMPTLATRLASVDASLARPDPDPHKAWRISPGGLTLIRVKITPRADDPREIEVGDSEVTVSQFLRRRPEHRYEKSVTPSVDGPVGSVSWESVAEFCNRLGEEEKIAPGEACFERSTKGKPVRSEGIMNRHGYRIPTAREFAEFSLAGTTSLRYYGSSDDLLGRYEWHRQNALHAEPVASLKPNDLGLFDVLGNLVEWCDHPEWKNDGLYQAIIAWSYMAGGEALRSDVVEPRLTQANFGWIHYGFRVCRTVN